MGRAALEAKVPSSLRTLEAVYSFHSYTGVAGMTTCPGGGTSCDESVRGDGAKIGFDSRAQVDSYPDTEVRSDTPRFGSGKFVRSNGTVPGESHSRGCSAPMADQVPDPAVTTSMICRGGDAPPGGQETDEEMELRLTLLTV